MSKRRLLTTGLIAFIALSSCIYLFPPAIHSQATLVLNTADSPPNSTPDNTGIIDKILNKAFERIGVRMKIVDLPSERALVNANEGIDDGNFVRIKGMDAIYPNLVQVPENLVKFEFVAFTKKPDFKPNGWDSLKPYNVGIIRGWKILEANIVGTKSLTRVKNEKALFYLLQSDKVDIVVYDRIQGLAVARNLHYGNIHAATPPLVVKDMYLYLNKRHKDLIPLLTAAIKDIKKDGTYNAIVNQGLSACFKGEEVSKYGK